MDSKTEKIVFDEFDKKQLGGSYGIMVYMKDFVEEVDKSNANTSILYIYDENDKVIQRIYGEL